MAVDRREKLFHPVLMKITTKKHKHTLIKAIRNTQNKTHMISSLSHQEHHAMHSGTMRESQQRPLEGKEHNTGLKRARE